MDALSFLRADHQSVLGMFEVLDGAPKGTGSVQSGLDTMVTNLVIAESQHEAIEEQLFWLSIRRWHRRIALAAARRSADRVD